MIFGEDIIKSDGMFGEYDDIFGNWISYDMAPDGYFYDHDGDPGTESLLMAHFKDDSDGGKWIMNRAIESNGKVTSEYYGNAGVVYASVAKVEEVLIAMSTGLDLCAVNPNVPCLAGVDSIEDLAKFNVTYSIDQIAFGIPDGGGQFSLRVTAAVPEPETLPLLGLGLIALFRMRRRVIPIPLNL